MKVVPCLLKNILSVYAERTEQTITVKATNNDYTILKYQDLTTDDDLLGMASLAVPRFKFHYVDCEKKERIQSRSIIELNTAKHPILQ